MNIYILVEGKRTETKIYPGWLAHLCPYLVEIDAPEQKVENSFFMVSANGYSKIPLMMHAAIDDVNRFEHYTDLLVIFDQEEREIAQCEEEIGGILARHPIKRSRFHLVIQSRCIETWLLGNQKALSGRTQGDGVNNLFSYYDVRVEDPEKMGYPRGREFNTHAQFHEHYLRLVLGEKALSYTKRNPGIASEGHYVETLMQRHESFKHIKTFGRFVDFVNSVNSRRGG